jgi:predicted adenylyl cyclase CyaB
MFMATNIEIKARVDDIDGIRRLAEGLSDGPVELIPQEDIFFHTAQGRLKLRIFSPDSGQLIYYERSDQAGPKRSDYHITDTSEPGRLREILAMALETRGVVRKQRWLYWSGNTRIHVDEVEGLGSFMELEVMLQEGQDAAEGEVIAAELMAELGISNGDLVESAYIDLLENRSAAPTRPGD